MVLFPQAASAMDDLGWQLNQTSVDLGKHRQIIMQQICEGSPISDFRILFQCHMICCLHLFRSCELGTQRLHPDSKRGRPKDTTDTGIEENCAQTPASSWSVVGCSLN